MCELLPYENQIFLDLFENDGLLVMAEGMGIERIFMNFIKLYCDQTHLVMIINTNESEEKYFINKLKEMKIDYLPTKITNETHSVNERTQAYMKGGCFFITSRILVVDMLTDRVPIELINGILVYKAHRIIDNCQETFILRLFRQKNKKGFIKALSDDPIYFAKSFCKVDRVMKNLFVKKLFIYPRFHVDVESTLEKHKPEVIEIHVDLSYNMNSTQMALLDIINVLLQELKGCCTYIDHDFLTMENVISKPFDHIVKIQLEPVWNQVGSKPKQLIADIRTLRLLLYYLTQYDCVTFFKMLTCLKSQERELGKSSGWIFLDAANQLFTNARLRVYGTKLNDKIFIDKQKLIFNKDNKELANRIIEESPKLKALKSVLEEISEDKDEDSEEINVLIAGNDDRTCLQIKQFLNNSNMVTSLSSSSKDLEKIDLINKNANDDDEEKDDEFIEKMLLRNNLETDPVSTLIGHKRKRKQKAKEGGITLTQMMKKSESKGKSTKKKGKEQKKESESESGDSGSDDEIVQTEKPSKSINEKINIFLSALEGSSKQKVSLLRLIHELKPKYVVLYDIELRFVRQLEIYKILNPDRGLRIYFLMYKNSCEEQRYLTAIRSEKEAFEMLIKEKATMIIPEEQDGKLEALVDKDEQEQISIAMKMSSRKGGSAVAATSEEIPRVIVDMREFRSELPSLLHKRGIHVEPVTLEVGDYILTPDICVERKSINDLIESLANGRLYNQCTVMCRSYKHPLLLIEFDQNKPFVLNSNIVWSNEISAQSISSKLVLLTIHFPKLKILWCSSPHETAEIFEELKSGYPQPNAETAMAIKTNQVNEELSESKYNPVLQEILLKIPGINIKNCRSIMANVENLYELCQLSEERLTEIIENSKNAKIIYEFLNKAKNEAALDEFGEEIPTKPDTFQKKTLITKKKIATKK